MNVCQLDKPPFYQCCCMCVNRVKIVTNDMQFTGKHVCALSLSLEEISDFVIDCEEHSAGCECWWDKRKVGKNEGK